MHLDAVYVPRRRMAFERGLGRRPGKRTRRHPVLDPSHAETAGGRAAASSFRQKRLKTDLADLREPWSGAMTTVSQSENQESSEGADEMPTFSAAGGRKPARQHIERISVVHGSSRLMVQFQGFLFKDSFFQGLACFQGFVSRS
jgi:hypothetical protein